MELKQTQVWREGRGLATGLTLFLASILLAGCATTVSVTAPSVAPAQVASSSEDDDFSQLIAQLRLDLNRSKSRELSAPKSAAKGSASSEKPNREFAARAKALFANIESITLMMPVVGVRITDLYNSWGDSRDGGRRRHRGIDIFARKGTQIVAVADGVVSYIGVQPKGGNCLWLTTENGSSFYYAHLDRWAPGLYEGMQVTSGDLLGYVGNTGNALTTPAHLHFGINSNDEMVNPYPLLSKANIVRTARAQDSAGGHYGGGFGTK